MRGWRCGRCGQVVFLDSSQCLRCGAGLGFRPSTLAVEVLDGSEVLCATGRTSGCTWIVEDDARRCVACRQVTLVPPLDDPSTAARYRRAADDHRRLVVQLLELGLPVGAVRLRLPSGTYDPSVVIGHTDGVITLDVDEVDDAHREAARHSLGERYRTVLGHLRHEYGHALFPHIVPADQLPRVRELFGDERDDYASAKDDHYANGPPAGWQATHVSAYATMHPSEDWAETFAHLLHATDVLRTSSSFGVTLTEDSIARQMLSATGSTTRLLDRFVPLAFALNEVSQAMGEGALYPFVLSEVATIKLELVAELVGVGPDGTATTTSDPAAGRTGTA